MYKARAWFALVCVCWMLVTQQQAYAQAALAPVENYVVNRAIGGMIANRIALARGVAANDAGVAPFNQGGPGRVGSDVVDEIQRANLPGIAAIHPG